MMSTALTVKIVIAALGLGAVLLVWRGSIQQSDSTPPVKSVLENFQMTERQKAVNNSMQTVIVRPDAQMK